jgi:ABC-type ATPase with predicted acetyltransferase domain
MSSFRIDLPMAGHPLRAPIAGSRDDVPAREASIGSAISIRGLSRRFGRFTAVDNVDLQIEPGEFVTLPGPSGSGKTTLLGAIAGFAEVDAGGRAGGLQEDRRCVGREADSFMSRSGQWEFPEWAGPEIGCRYPGKLVASALPRP